MSGKYLPPKMAKFRAAEEIMDDSINDGSKLMLQEVMAWDEWGMLVGCILLNQTTYAQVHQVIWNLFRKYPTAVAMMNANKSEVTRLIESLGMQKKKAETLLKFSREYGYNPWNDVRELHGIGDYASDSHEIFIKKNFDVEPTDKELIKYLEQNEDS